MPSDDLEQAVRSPRAATAATGSGSPCPGRRPRGSRSVELSHTTVPSSATTGSAIGATRPRFASSKSWVSENGRRSRSSACWSAMIRWPLWSGHPASMPAHRPSVSASTRDVRRQRQEFRTLLADFRRYANPSSAVHVRSPRGAVPRSERRAAAGRAAVRAAQERHRRGAAGTWRPVGSDAKRGRRPAGVAVDSDRGVQPTGRGGIHRRPCRGWKRRQYGSDAGPQTPPRLGPRTHRACRGGDPVRHQAHRIGSIRPATGKCRPVPFPHGGLAPMPGPCSRSPAAAVRGSSRKPRPP